MLNMLRRIPIIGVFLRYLNLYVGKGEPCYLIQWAPLNLWLDRLLVPVFKVVCLVATLMLLAEYKSIPVKGSDISDIIVSAFPSLLGFGIGVFALIFVVPRKFLDGLDQRREQRGFGSTMMVSDLAYPLSYLIFALILSPILEPFLDGWISTFTQLFLLLYGGALIADLIAVIAISAIRVRHDNNSDSEPDGATDQEAAANDPSKTRKGD